MKRKDELTYEDFKIGQKVTCIKNDTDGIWTDWHLTIGKEYKITDLDFHFWDTICIKTNRKLEMFVPIKYFADIKYVRKLKLQKIGKKNL